MDKADEVGKPRLFLNHREAARWALLAVAKVLGALALYTLPRSVFGPAGGEVGRSMLTIILLVVPLAIWLLISAVL